ncbi:MAG: hypothetical protein NZM06_00655 [Chloroherpetonaceae bacterium]|nr:hypothetical protein [Chloroherpetonaceae bacterium]MDW8438113.1 hypothetical protein [Chloroherpetonaceae bacterium]
MRYLFLCLLVGELMACQSSASQPSLIGSFRGKTVRAKEPKNGAFTTVYIPVYEIGLTISEGEFSGTQKREDGEPIVIRGKYRLGGKPNVVHFIAESVANEVVLLDGVFAYALKDKTLTLAKQDGSLTIELTKLPQR